MDKWKFRHGKFLPFNEKATPVLLDVGDLDLNDEDDALVVGTCPFCGGLLGVDWTYLDQVTNVIHCPMCCEELTVEDE